MNPDSNQCPADPAEIAEAYVMGMLTKEQETVFEGHYANCEKCAATFQKTAEYVEAMRAAAKKLREGPQG